MNRRIFSHSYFFLNKNISIKISHEELANRNLSSFQLMTAPGMAIPKISAASLYGFCAFSLSCVQYYVYENDSQNNVGNRKYDGPAFCWHASCSNTQFSVFVTHTKLDVWAIERVVGVADKSISSVTDKHQIVSESYKLTIFP